MPCSHFTILALTLEKDERNTRNQEFSMDGIHFGKLEKRRADDFIFTIA